MQQEGSYLEFGFVLIKKKKNWKIGVALQAYCKQCIQYPDTDPHLVVSIRTKPKENTKCTGIVCTSVQRFLFHIFLSFVLKKKKKKKRKIETKHAKQQRNAH